MKWIAYSGAILGTGLLLIAGFFLFGRGLGGTALLEKAVLQLSQAQTIEFSARMERFSETGEKPFVFGDVQVESKLDVSAAPLLRQHSDFVVSVTPRAVSDQASLSFFENGETVLVNVESGPRAFLDTLASAGLKKNTWAPLESRAEFFAFLGESALPVFETKEQVAALRALVAQTAWVKSAQPTLTEIIGGSVARLYTIELNASAIAEFEAGLIRVQHGREPTQIEENQILGNKQLYEATRVNAWVDQHSGQFRRLLIQVANVSQLEIEILSINAPIEIQIPTEKGLPESSNRPEQIPVESEPVVEEPSVQSEPAAGFEFGAPMDPDGDGLTNESEAFYGTDINVADTDGDGYSDGDEVKNGYNPLGEGKLFNFGLPEFPL